ncbi:MAG: hypothetical protein ABFD61_07200 [Chloroherpetonaceae bacterium]
MMKNHSAKSLKMGIGLSLWLYGLKKTLQAPPCNEAQPITFHWYV